MKRPKKHEDDEITLTTVRLPRSLLKRAKISAAVNETSMQALIIRLLDEHCTKEEKRQ
jgi:hypothetical protein